MGSINSISEIDKDDFKKEITQIRENNLTLSWTPLPERTPPLL